MSQAAWVWRLSTEPILGRFIIENVFCPSSWLEPVFFLLSKAHPHVHHYVRRPTTLQQVSFAELFESGKIDILSWPIRMDGQKRNWEELDSNYRVPYWTSPRRYSRRRKKLYTYIWISLDIVPHILLTKTNDGTCGVILLLHPMSLSTARAITITGNVITQGLEKGSPPAELDMLIQSAGLIITLAGSLILSSTSTIIRLAAILRSTESGGAFFRATDAAIEWIRLT